MSRRRIKTDKGLRPTYKKRATTADGVFNSRLVAMMVAKLMLDGKKSVSESIFYGALERIKERTGDEALEVFNNAVRNATPLVEVKARRVGGATYQVPMEVRADRGTALALRWIIAASRKRPGKSMVDKLSNELMDAAKETGNAIRKREETHKMAEANKAFAHYHY